MLSTFSIVYLVGVLLARISLGKIVAEIKVVLEKILEFYIATTFRITLISDVVCSMTFVCFPKIYGVPGRYQHRDVHMRHCAPNCL